MSAGDVHTQHAPGQHPLRAELVAAGVIVPRADRPETTPHVDLGLPVLTIALGGPPRC